MRKASFSQKVFGIVLENKKHRNKIAGEILDFIYRIIKTLANVKLNCL